MRSRRKSPSSSKPKKLVGIAKVLEAGTWKHVKYHFNDSSLFLGWLVQKYQKVAYMNLYVNLGADKGRQIANWTEKAGWLDH